MKLDEKKRKDVKSMNELEVTGPFFTMPVGVQSKESFFLWGGRIH